MKRGIQKLCLAENNRKLIRANGHPVLSWSFFMSCSFAKLWSKHLLSRKMLNSEFVGRDAALSEEMSQSQEQAFEKHSDSPPVPFVVSCWCSVVEPLGFVRFLVD